MEQNNSKKVLLSVLGVAILIVAVVGISFAALNYDKVGGTNSITTGTVSMSFSEVTKGILLEDALPISDTKGKELSADGQFFDFSVSTTTDGALDVDYEINVTPATITETTTTGKLTDSQVKVYLEKKNAEGNYEQLVAPVKADTLAASTVRTGSQVLQTVTSKHTGAGTITDEYRLRIWVAEDVNVESINDKKYEYRITVNVDGKATPIDVTP